jgi:A1 cistron-splicing factor AAR2
MATPAAAARPSVSAADMLRHTATVVCLDVPEGTELGLDLHCWTTGPRFKGVKLVPPGPHALYYASAAGEVRSACLMLVSPAADA